MQISEVPQAFIKNSIDIGIIMSKHRNMGINTYPQEYYLGPDNDLVKLYFAGQTLCLDVDNVVHGRGVILVSYNKESFNYNANGESSLSKLMPIATLRSLQELMDLNNINYAPKTILQ